jgi:hypothetical protein
MNLTRLLPLGLLTLTGCPLDSTEPLIGDGGVADGGVADGGVQQEAGWRNAPNTCGGHTTEALLATGASTFYVGCGTGAVGRGVWRTTDAGDTWAIMPGTETWRINDIEASGDGLIIAGIDTESRVAVGHLLDGVVTPIWTRGNQVGWSFQVGSYAQTDAGAAIAESLTGGDLVYRANAEADWESQDRWATDDAPHQMLMVDTDGVQFFGVGSTITEPPTVFIPADVHFNPVRPFAEGVTGELWGLAHDGGRILVAGVDQGADTGLAALGAIDAHTPADWRVLPLAEQVEGSSWFRGACMRGDSMVVVGERQPLRRDNALAFRSDDAGQTWRQLTPPDAPTAWHRCALLADGRLALAGANGAFAIHTP